jgi:alkylation response protein AidB-like acyl-CoA dehydrogenase
VADLEIRLKALELTTLRILIGSQSGTAPGSEANLLKVKGSEIQQDISELMMDAVGRYAFAYDPHAWVDGWRKTVDYPDYAATVAGVYFNTRKVSIYGGSNEIQRNVLAKTALGL